MHTPRRRALAALTAATLALGAATFAPGAAAQDAAAGVRHAIKAIWDKPGAPVDVSPVSVVGRHAIAGWTQEDRGGRALLRQEQGRWVVTVCGGDGLIKTDALQLAGLGKSEAESLSRMAEKAEAAIPAERRKKFALFEGMVNVDASHKPGDHGHAAHKH